MSESESGTEDDFREVHLRDGDFLGAFALMESEHGILMVQNERVIGGRSVRVWDLPGGQVEPGEELRETLARELREEVGVRPASDDAPFLFMQEGVRTIAGRRAFAWRSFFFSVPEWIGEPAAGSEVLAIRFVPRDQISEVLTAPYHDSFHEWLRVGGTFFSSAWRD